MVRSAARSATLLAGLSLVFAMWAGLTTVVAGRMPGPALTVVLALAALAVSIALAFAGKRIERPPARPAVLAAVSGLLGLFLAPYLVLTHRYSDAPPGTELLFFTTACWGAIAAASLAVGWWRSGARQRAFSILAGAVVALVGCAGVLGNWERPSSFSPFIRFFAEELWMLVAGVAFVTGVLLMRSALARVGVVSLPIGAGAALVAAIVAWLAAGDPLMWAGRLPEMGSVVALWAAAGAMVWIAWTGRLAADEPAVSVAALFLPPVLLPALSALERLVGMAGPEPLVWGGIIGGSLLVVAGVTRIVVWRVSRPASSPARGWTLAAMAVASMPVVAAAVALALPALKAEVTGVRADGALGISWTLAGWESVAGLAAFALALLLLAVMADRAVLAALVALGSIPAYWLLARTPTHVLTRWLSPDIQQDYGTEYAAITFRALPVWPARLAVAGVGVGLAVVLTYRLWRWRGRGADSPDTSLEA